MGFVSDDTDDSKLQLEKICTPEPNTHSFPTDHHTPPTSSATERQSSQAIDLNTCTYSPPIRTTYYTESTTPWLQGKPLNVSAFRVEYSTQNQVIHTSRCISEEDVRSYLHFVSIKMRFLTNNKAFLNVGSSFVSPICIPSSYKDTEPPNNDVIRLLNTENASLYNDPHDQATRACTTQAIILKNQPMSGSRMFLHVPRSAYSFQACFPITTPTS